MELVSAEEVEEVSPWKDWTTQRVISKPTAFSAAVAVRASTIHKIRSEKSVNQLVSYNEP